MIFANDNNECVLYAVLIALAFLSGMQPLSTRKIYCFYKIYCIYEYIVKATQGLNDLKMRAMRRSGKIGLLTEY